MAGSDPAVEAVVTACNAARRRLLRLHDELGSWRKVGAEIGVTGAMAYRVAMQGYQPKDAEIRRKLRLPPLTDSLCADLMRFLTNEEMLMQD